MRAPTGPLVQQDHDASTSLPPIRCFGNSSLSPPRIDTSDAFHTCPIYLLLQAAKRPVDLTWERYDCTIMNMKELQIPGIHPLSCRQVKILGQNTVLGPQSGLSLRSKQLVDSEAGPLSHEGHSPSRLPQTILWTSHRKSPDNCGCCTRATSLEQLQSPTSRHWSISFCCAATYPKEGGPCFRAASQAGTMLTDWCPPTLLQ